MYRLKFSSEKFENDVFACRQKLYTPESIRPIFKQTRVNIFHSEKMTSFLEYVTANLRALFT